MACNCFNRPWYQLIHVLYGIIFKEEPERVHVLGTSCASDAKVRTSSMPSTPSVADLSFTRLLNPTVRLQQTPSYDDHQNFCKQLTEIRESQGALHETYSRYHEIAAFACLPPCDSSCSINGAHLLFPR